MELNQSSTLPGRVRVVIHYKHYSIMTVNSYVQVIGLFTAFETQKS